MPASDPDIPGWLAWVVPIVTGVTAMVVVIRKLLTASLREDFAKMLQEKHAENLAKLEAIENQMETARTEREQIKLELARIGRDVAYMRGVRRMPDLPR